MNTAHWILHHLKDTPGYRILLHFDCDLRVHAYYDAD